MVSILMRLNLRRLVSSCVKLGTETWVVVDRLLADGVCCGVLVSDGIW